jgi:hypothetical protein
MRKNPRRILSPQRLPFRHPGSVGSRKISTTISATKVWNSLKETLPACLYEFTGGGKSAA